MTTVILVMSLAAHAGGGGGLPKLVADQRSARCMGNPRLPDDVLMEDMFIQMPTGDGERIYWIKGGARHLVPDRNTVESWYTPGMTAAFCLDVQEVPAELGNTLREGTHLTIRPGAYILRLPQMTSLWVVEAPNTIREITYEQAEAMYGTGWIDYTRPVWDVYFTDYCVGPDITTPTGMVDPMPKSVLKDVLVKNDTCN